jgi:ubiquinone biosynthesis protein UbiJ
VNQPIADPFHAWFVLTGIVIGMALMVAFLTVVAWRVTRILSRAEKLVEEMKTAISQATVLARHVSNEYAPLKARVDKLEIRVEAMERYDAES